MQVTRRDLHRLTLGSAVLTGAALGSQSSAEAGTLETKMVPLTNTDFEPLGGQPPQGSRPSTDNLDYQVKYQRAFEAILWGAPAVAIYRFRGAAFDDLGLKDNDIIAYSTTASPKLEALRVYGQTGRWVA